MSLSDFEIVQTTTGATSIRNKIVNEIMHNPIGPWQEANALYVEQSGLRLRLQNGRTNDLVIYDIGLGAASNAVASIHCALTLGQAGRRLHIISFENNLALLEFTLLNAHEFSHLTGYSEALEAILRDHHWTSPCGRIVWDLRAGDFLDLIDQETSYPEIVYFDPYSPSVNEDMWTLSCFTKLRLRCAAAEGQEATDLFTYSIATPIRAAMFLAGFYVGYGLPTGLKVETTHASTHLNTLSQPLSERWYERWQRSDKQLPFDAENYDSLALQRRMAQHSQFNGMSPMWKPLNPKQNKGLRNLVNLVNLESNPQPVSLG